MLTVITSYFSWFWEHLISASLIILHPPKEKRKETKLSFPMEETCSCCTREFDRRLVCQFNFKCKIGRRERERNKFSRDISYLYLRFEMFKLDLKSGGINHDVRNCLKTRLTKFNPGEKNLELNRNGKWDQRSFGKLIFLGRHRNETFYLKFIWTFNLQNFRFESISNSFPKFQNSSRR